MRKILMMLLAIQSIFFISYGYFLYQGHRKQEQANSSLMQIMQSIDEYQQLNSFALELIASGNDVFGATDLERAKVRLKISYDSFVDCITFYMSTIYERKYIHLPSGEQGLDIFINTAKEINALGGEILKFYRSGDIANAVESLGRLDRRGKKLILEIANLDQLVNDQQLIHLVKSQEKLDEKGLWAGILASVVLLMGMVISLQGFRKEKGGQKEQENLTEQELIIEQPLESKGKILVVDDQPFWEKKLVNQLRELGYHADGISTGALALEYVRVRDYQLLYLDIAMPLMDGLTTVMEIRKLAESSRAEVAVVGICLSEHADLIRAAELAGMNQLISKTTTPEKLKKITEKYIQQATQNANPAFDISLI